MTHRTARHLARIMLRVNRRHRNASGEDRLALSCKEATKELGRPIRSSDFLEAVDTLNRKRDASKKTTL